MGWGFETNYCQRSESFWIKENDHLYLVDTGASKKGKTFIKKYKSILNKLNILVISHGDNDHIGLFETVISECKPEIIVISPEIYIMEKYKYYTDQPTDLYSIFNDNLYNVNEEYLNNSEDSEAPFVVYATYRTNNTAPLPWNTSTLNGLCEFETFPTKSTKKIIPKLNKLINRLISNPAKLGFFNFQLVEKLIKKYIRNDRSLICRIGTTFFTGDATVNQLNEVRNKLVNESKIFNHKCTVKINHHGSVQKKYQYYNFYALMQPRQLLLKRDYSITKAKKTGSMFLVYINSLKKIPSVKHFIDPTSSTKIGSFFKTY